MKPQALLTDGLYHLRYNFPYQILCSCVYPLPSPNGSSIIICGHEQGLLILWRGGRPYKPQPEPKQPSKPRMTNGTSKVKLIDTEMADDSASEESTKPEDEQEDDFLDEEKDYDPNTPYLPILEQLDLPFGLATSSICVPSIPYSIQSAEFRHLPKITQEHMIITTVCADNSIRIITLPLLPPHPRTRKRAARMQKSKSYTATATGLWKEKVYILQSPSTRQTLPKGISVALVPEILKRSAESDQDQMEESHVTRGSGGFWDLLIASHSHDLTGVLCIHKIGLPSKDLNLRGEDESAPPEWLWREQRLLRPAKSIHLYASQKTLGSNPSVVVTERRGAVRTYRCDPASPTDSGSWGIAIFPDLESTDPTETKYLLDAKMVLGGQAIATITSESTWVLYDLRQIGTMPTKAVATGSIGKSVIARESNTAGATKLGSKLAPMTPSTRRVRQEKLFAGLSQKPSTSPSGSIFLTSASDSMTVWHGDRMSTISNLQAYLDRTPQELRNPLAAVASHQIRELNLAINGPSPTSLAIITSPYSPTRERAVQPDVLITGQRSITIITPPLTRPPAPVCFLAAAEVEDDSAHQQLLNRGDLSIEGVDRLLARLEADKGIKTGEDLFSRVKNR